MAARPRPAPLLAPPGGPRLAARPPRGAQAPTPTRRCRTRSRTSSTSSRRSCAPASPSTAPRSTSTPGRTARPSAEATAGILHGQVADLEEHLARIEDAGDEQEAHEARIRAKRVRYLLEPLVDEIPGAAPVVKRFKALQDLLGDLHDAHVLEAELAEAVETAAAERAGKLLELSLADAPDDDPPPRRAPARPRVRPDRARPPEPRPPRPPLRGPWKPSGWRGRPGSPCARWKGWGRRWWRRRRSRLEPGDLGGDPITPGHLLRRPHSQGQSGTKKIRSPLFLCMSVLAVPLCGPLCPLFSNTPRPASARRRSPAPPRW